MRFSTTVFFAAATVLLPLTLPAQKTITGQAAFADWNQQQPGVRRKITLADLPQPKPEEAVNNTPHVIARPADAWPIAPAGFKVTLYAGGDTTPMQRADNKQVMTLSGGTFTMPRLIRTAPNGDLFLADSGAGTIFVLRGVGTDGKAAQIEKFATGLDHPFGIAFYPSDNPQVRLRGQRHNHTAHSLPLRRPACHWGAETIVPDIPGYAQLTGGGHWTRDVVFTKDGQHMLVSVGSGSNVDDPTPTRRSSIAPTFSNTRPTASSSRSTPTASATASAKPSIQPPASSGAPPTSATTWAITSFPTTSLR
jgi:glucose/arabinose dehydrogenase